MTDPIKAFAGGTAVITGAGSGIGAGLARLAAQNGMDVAMVDVAADRVENEARAICDGGGRARAYVTDVSNPEAMDALAAQVLEQHGNVRLLVNNAGIETLGFSWELSAAQWDRALGVNIRGVVNGVRAFVPGMIAAGEPGFIANTSSIGGLSIMPVQTAYIMSKHAVLAFTECLRLEMAAQQHPISVSVILPGPVQTRIFDDAQSTEAAVSRYHAGVMRAMTAENGVTPDEAARVILPEIAAGQFWVSTHPEMTREFAAARAGQLAELATPTLSPELLAMLRES
jgi:NAD(P)-dependent dehydrogenase (short-subunit alcohol dehydrogenase family)